MKESEEKLKVQINSNSGLLKIDFSTDNWALTKQLEELQQKLTEHEELQRQKQNEEIERATKV